VEQRKVAAWDERFAGRYSLGFPQEQTFQDNSTFGQKESASQEEKHGEKTANTIDGQLDIASGLP